MCRDYFKRITTERWTAEDIGYVAYRRGRERMIKKMIKRSARRTDKMIVKGLI